MQTEHLQLLHIKSIRLAKHGVVIGFQSFCKWEVEQEEEATVSCLRTS